MRALILLVIYVGSTVYCLTDVSQQEDRRPFGLHKYWWIAVILLLPYIGAAAWILMRIVRGGSSMRAPSPVAPDDDPEYLGWLQNQRRRKRGRSDE